VPSNVQIIASAESGDAAALHFSHVRLISSMAELYLHAEPSCNPSKSSNNEPRHEQSDICR
jgi:hypothetical protein